MLKKILILTLLLAPVLIGARIATADDGVAIYSANSDKLDGSDASVFTGADTALGLSSATLQGNIDTVEADTGTLKNSITALESSTGTLPVLIIMDSTTLTNASTRDVVFSTGVFESPGSTWNVVLPAVADNEGLSFTISMGVADNVLSLTVSGGGNISGVTPFTEIDAIYDCATLQVRNGEWIVTQKLIAP